MISIVVPSYRAGGIDVLTYGLLNQKLQDFELILVDCLYDYRKETVSAYLSEKGLRFKYAKPEPFKFPIDAVPSCRNTGLRHAEGELVVWWVDYTYATPDCLERHWRLYKERGCCSVGVHQYLTMPKLKSNLPLNSETSLESYLEIVKKTREFDISIFEEEFNGIYNLQADENYGKDPKLGCGEGPIDGDYFHAKNEAVPLQIQMTVGGFNEKFDSGHCYDDMEMGRRLQKASTLWLDKSNIVYIVNPRHLFAKARPTMLRSPEENFKLLNV